MTMARRMRPEPRKLKVVERKLKVVRPKIVATQKVAAESTDWSKLVREFLEECDYSDI